MNDLSTRNLIVIPGVQKSGTSTLAHMITNHEDVCPLSNSEGRGIKESNFFALTPSVVESNLNFYASLFDKSNCPKRKKFFVDASPSYFMSPKAPQLIERYVGTVQYVVIVRDPIERAHSSYLHMRRKNDPPENRSFEEIIERILKNPEDDVAAAEDEEVERAIREGTVDPNYKYHRRGLNPHLNADFPLRYQSPLAPFKYIQHSMYSKWLPKYERSSSALTVVSLEQLSETPVATVNGVFRNIGLSEKKK